jgi:hypothetical protein
MLTVHFLNSGSIIYGLDSSVGGWLKRDKVLGAGDVCGSTDLHDGPWQASRLAAEAPHKSLAWVRCRSASGPFPSSIADPVRISDWALHGPCGQAQTQALAPGHLGIGTGGTGALAKSKQRDQDGPRSLRHSW